MDRIRPSRISSQKILADLRVASKKGDRTSLALALDGMRTLALSPRYWQKYLALLRNPLARLVDLLVIKQGDRIVHQKGWKVGGEASPRKARRGRSPRSKRGSATRRRPPAPAARSFEQPSLF